MTTIITITGEVYENTHTIPDYTNTDRILKNIMTDDYEIMYSGQNKGLKDHVLIRSVRENTVFKIYYRKKKNIPFTYLGETIRAEIIQERKVPVKQQTEQEERLLLRLIVPQDNVKNTTVSQIHEGLYRYKKDLLADADFELEHYNGMDGFYYKE